MAIIDVKELKGKYEHDEWKKGTLKYKTIKENQMEILKLRNVITEVKYSLGDLKIILEVAEESQ